MEIQERLIDTSKQEMADSVELILCQFRANAPMKRGHLYAAEATHNLNECQRQLGHPNE